MNAIMSIGKLYCMYMIYNKIFGTQFGDWDSNFDASSLDVEGSDFDLESYEDLVAERNEGWEDFDIDEW